MTLRVAVIGPGISCVYFIQVCYQVVIQLSFD